MKSRRGIESLGSGLKVMRDMPTMSGAISLHVLKL